MITKLVTSNPKYLDFIEDLITQIKYFKEAVEYGGNKSETTIKNMDLWVDAYIEIFPELQEFRNIIHCEMKRLNIQPYSELIYKEENHYAYSNKKSIEILRIAMNKA